MNREDGVQYFLAMPYIFRENTIKRYEKNVYRDREKNMMVFPDPELGKLCVAETA